MDERRWGLKCKSIFFSFLLSYITADLRERISVNLISRSHWHSPKTPKSSRQWKRTIKSSHKKCRSSWCCCQIRLYPRSSRPYAQSPVGGIWGKWSRHASRFITTVAWFSMIHLQTQQMSQDWVIGKIKITHINVLVSFPLLRFVLFQLGMVPRFPKESTLNYSCCLSFPFSSEHIGFSQFVCGAGVCQSLST